MQAADSQNREVATLIQIGFGAARTEPAETSEPKASVSPERPGRAARGASRGRSRPRRRRAGPGATGTFVGLGEQALRLLWEAFLLGLMTPCFSSTQPARQPG